MAGKNTQWGSTKKKQSRSVEVAVNVNKNTFQENRRKEQKGNNSGMAPVEVVMGHTAGADGTQECQCNKEESGKRGPTGGELKQRH